MQRWKFGRWVKVGTVRWVRAGGTGAGVRRPSRARNATLAAPTVDASDRRASHGLLQGGPLPETMTLCMKFLKSCGHVASAAYFRLEKLLWSATIRCIKTRPASARMYSLSSA
jgi:hypothetical protein